MSTQVAEKSPSKSAAIVQQLDSLETAVAKLETLADRVEGSGNSEEPLKGRDLDNMSISTLLTTIPELLDGFASDIHKATNKITDALY